MRLNRLIVVQNGPFVLYEKPFSNKRSLPLIGTAAGVVEMKRVLIVEDEPVLLELLVTIIDELGFSTTTAATVDDGIELLDSHAWTMVITDVRTPGRSDGWDLAWTAYHQWPSLAVIVTSGGNANFGKPLPPSAVFLAKPWSIDQMTSLVQSRAEGFASLP